MKKIYVVTSGCYSDYGIEAIFSTKKLADKFVNGRASFDIEEWTLDDEDLLSLMKGLSYYIVDMNRKGDVLNIENPSVHAFDSDGVLGMRCSEFHFFVIAKNKEHAIKIANERRAIMIANDLHRLEK